MPSIESLLGRGKIELDGGMTMRREPGVIMVKLPVGREQLIHYSTEGEFHILVSAVATPRAVKTLGTEEVARMMLKRNRVSSVVAFVFSRKGGLEGRVVQRAATAQQAELKFYIGLLAREADRFEFLLTGENSQ